MDCYKRLLLFQAATQMKQANLRHLIKHTLDSANLRWPSQLSTRIYRQNVNRLTKMTIDGSIYYENNHWLRPLSAQNRCRRIIRPTCLHKLHYGWGNPQRTLTYHSNNQAGEVVDAFFILQGYTTLQSSLSVST